MALSRAFDSGFHGYIGELRRNWCGIGFLSVDDWWIFASEQNGRVVRVRLDEKVDNAAFMLEILSVESRQKRRVVIAALIMLVTAIATQLRKRGKRGKHKDTGLRISIWFITPVDTRIN